MTGILHVITTTAEQGDAQRIATSLVANRLAACVQVDGPIDSVYRWKGAIEESQEWRLTIKTIEELYPKIEQAIIELHPYQQPEIVATTIVTGSKGYLQWIADSLQPITSE